MSWFSQNYEKAAIGGAALIAVGFTICGWLKKGNVQADFSANTQGAGNNDPSIPNADLVPKAKSSLGLNRTWVQAEAENRAVDLFTGIPLHIARDHPDKPVDLRASGSIHPPIPNIWWIDKGLDPGFADAPSRDDDHDGYSNLEEFNGKTDPKDPKSHPPLLDKLKYHTDESVKWFIRPGYQEGVKSPFKYGDDGGVGAGGVLSYKNKTKEPATAVAPDEIFFADGVAKERFKYLGSVKRRELNKAINMEVELTFAKIEDQKENKKGIVYEILHNFPEGDVQKWVQFDRKAVFSLEAIGGEGKEEKIEENTRFGLPFDSPNKDFLLKKVTADGVEIETTEAATGTKKTLTIRKGSFPQTTP
jgi:hypothetical protein